MEYYIRNYGTRSGATYIEAYGGWTTYYREIELILKFLQPPTQESPPVRNTLSLDLGHLSIRLLWSRPYVNGFPLGCCDHTALCSCHGHKNLMERDHYCPTVGLIIATQISHMVLFFIGDFQLFLESVCRLRVWWPADGKKEINYVCCGHYEPDDHDMTHLEDGIVGNAYQQRKSRAGVEDDATAAIGIYIKKVRWNVQQYISYADSSHVHVIIC